MHEPPLAFAHRGGAEYGPNQGIENSVVAFRNAHDMGYRYFETDVRATRDGVVYACHDATLERLTGSADPIAALDSSVIESHLLGDREPMVQLEALLNEFPDTCFNIDVKSDDAVAETLEVIRRTDSMARVCLAAFSHRRLRRIRALAPEALTSASTLEAARMVGGLALPRTPQFFQVPVRHHGVEVVTNAFVKRAHRLGQQVHVWTIDEADEMNRLLDLGVDGIMTDRIDTLKDVLVQRGQWKEPT